MIMRLPTSVKNARSCFQFYGEREQNGNRKAIVSTNVFTSSIFTGYAGGVPTYIVQYNLRVQGVPYMKNFWGTYKNYDTDNRLTADFTFRVSPLNSGGQFGSSVVVDDVSNQNQYSINIDRTLSLGYTGIISDPLVFTNEHYYHLDDAIPGQLPVGTSSPNNTYGTRGVNTFQYGCPL